ncbi:unnamed protein product [Larinioides sclopetarius]|uniref:Amidase domain-containing protein n=1 Tax=Larinioides sclopetarius TaxID=280406 RepID=A0AAV2B7V2_9ARAC
MESEILYWIIQTLLVIVRSTLHLVMMIFHRGKKKVVPSVKNPMLLKSASTLARDIREGRCKSEDVIKAYIERILEVEPCINATAELCFDNALKKAREVDGIIASKKYTKEQLSLEKPLFGVPISVKGLFHIKNMPFTGGSLLFSDLKVTEDAPTVATLKKAGAIVIATTNVPELGLDMETHNKIYGRTCNPYDTGRTSGGSSGGEAALISAGASVLGLGNDFLGSLRIPAHFTGIFSHKPSRGLVSNHGSSPFERPDNLHSCNAEVFKFLASGPMCRYAEDLITSMKVLTLDDAVRMKFDHHVDFKRVKIRYLREIRSPLIVPVDQDIAAGLENAVSYFQKQHDTAPQEITMPSQFDITRWIASVVVPLINDVKASTIGEKGLGLNEKLEFAKCLIGKSRLCFSTFINLNSASNPLLYRKSQSSYYQKIIEKCSDEFSKILDENTVLLMPTMPFTAPFHLETFPLLPSACYVALFNVLGLPVTHCPLGFTKKGLPYGIQIVGCQNNDPLTIACAVELEKAFGGWKSC